jgi:hypothetical protein
VLEGVKDIVELLGGKDVQPSQGLGGVVDDAVLAVARDEDGAAPFDRVSDVVDDDGAAAVEDVVDLRLRVVVWSQLARVRRTGGDAGGEVRRHGPGPGEEGVPGQLAACGIGEGLGRLLSCVGGWEDDRFRGLLGGVLNVHFPSTLFFCLSVFLVFRFMLLSLFLFFSSLGISCLSYFSSLSSPDVKESEREEGRYIYTSRLVVDTGDDASGP